MSEFKKKGQKRAISLLALLLLGIGVGRTLDVLGIGFVLGFRLDDRHRVHGNFDGNESPGHESVFERPFQFLGVLVDFEYVALPVGLVATDAQHPSR